MGAETPPRRRTVRSAKQQAQALNIEARRAKAAELRVAGYELQQIADRLGCSIGTVHSDLVAVFERTKEQADDYVKRERAVSVARLNAVTRAVMTKATKGHLGAADRVVKLEERRAKLEGLDAASKQEISGPAGGPLTVETKSSLESKLDQLAARLGNPQPGGTPGAGSGATG